MTATEETPKSANVGMGSLLRVGNARLYFTGVAISLFGDNMLMLAAGIWVKSLSGNNGAASLVSFFITGPVVLSPFFGMLADRVRRRTVLVASDLVMAAIAPTLLFVHDSGQIWLIYLVVLAYGTTNSLCSPAESGLLVTMLPERLLGTANSLLSSLTEGMKVLAPAAGAALFAWLGGGPVSLVDAATFLVSALTIAMLNVREPAPEPRRAERFSAELSAGIRRLTGSRELAPVILASGLALFVGGLILTALYGVVASSLHRPPAYLGLLVSVQGVGSVASGIVAPFLMARLKETRFVALGMAMTAVGTALIIVPSLVPILAGQFLRGLCQPWIVIGSLTAMQRRTPASLQGRMAGTVYMLLFVPQAVAQLIGAGLGQVITPQEQLAVIAVGTLVPCLYLLSRRGEAHGGQAEPGEATSERS